MITACTGDTCGKDLSRFQHETFEDFIVFIVHEFDFIFAEDTILSPGEVEFLLIFRSTGA
jgi:hypothetical protein